MALSGAALTAILVLTAVHREEAFRDWSESAVTLGFLTLVVGAVTLWIRWVQRYVRDYRDERLPLFRLDADGCEAALGRVA